MLINFATASSDMLTIGEVNRALERVQEFASEKDEDGRIQRANIIWGTSVKPELGDKLEVIIVVTGFPSEYYSEALTPKQPAEPIIAPQPEPADVQPPKPTIVLPKPQPQKPTISPLKPEPSRTMPSIISKSTRVYSEVQHRKSVPAYVTRKVEFITQISGKGKRATGKEEETDAQTPQTDATDASLKLF